MNRPGLSFLLTTLTLLASSHAQTITSCPTSKGYERVHHIAGYVVRISPGPKDSETDRCRGLISRPGAKPVVFAQALSMWIDNISGSDVNQDGIPEVVFGDYSLDQGCCFDYTIVSLGKNPALVRKIHNQVALHFRKESDDSVTIRTGDGSFDLFLLPHARAVIPDLTLRLKGNAIEDLSSHYQKEYDEKIAKARSEITPAALDKFRASDVHQKMFTDQGETMRSVLVVVVNYLYSGREAQAWQALDEMWPPADKDRVRSLMIERRARGLLTQLATTP